MTTMFSQDQEQRRTTGENRLPPGQRLTKEWPVLSYGATPQIDTDEWRFSVWGEVEEEITWSWEEFLAIGQESRFNDIHCVTHWSRYDNTWEGILMRDVLARIGIKPGVTAVMFHSFGGYSTNVSLEEIAKDDHAMFAVKHDGEPISPDHGGPMRGVIPSLYFWKSAKWIGGMELLPQNRPGFWEMYGYHLHGDPWKEERYS